MHAPSLFLTSESVTEGHPDKLCDQISDAVLDAIIEQDPQARVACETAVTTGLVVVIGEITTDCYVEIQDVVRSTVREVGYTRAKYGFDYDTCGVMVSIKEQSRDIAMGVDRSLEAREGIGDAVRAVEMHERAGPELGPPTNVSGAEIVPRLTCRSVEETTRVARHVGVGFPRGGAGDQDQRLARTRRKRQRSRPVVGRFDHRRAD